MKNLAEIHTESMICVFYRERKIRVEYGKLVSRSAEQRHWGCICSNIINNKILVGLAGSSRYHHLRRRPIQVNKEQ